LQDLESNQARDAYETSEFTRTLSCNKLVPLTRFERAKDN